MKDRLSVGDWVTHRETPPDKSAEKHKAVIIDLMLDELEYVFVEWLVHKKYPFNTLLYKSMFNISQLILIEATDEDRILYASYKLES